jgi:hypothetical protein
VEETNCHTERHEAKVYEQTRTLYRYRAQNCVRYCTELQRGNISALVNVMEHFLVPKLGGGHSGVLSQLPSPGGARFELPPLHGR